MKNNRLIILGASGHGKVVADIARLSGYREIFFLDDSENARNDDFPVIGKIADLPKHDGDVFVAIGHGATRKKFMESYPTRYFPVLIHPNAVVAKDSKISEVSVLMAGTVINSGSRIGRGCIVNTCSSVDHDCTIGDYVHIAVAAHLCGTVHVGQLSWIGAGAILINNISVADNCLVGAGGVVVKNLSASGTYVGVPVKKIK